MLEILKYATSGFWIFIGCFSLIAITGSVIAEILKAIFRKSDITIDLNDKEEKK